MVNYIDLFSAIPILIPILKPPFFPQKTVAHYDFDSLLVQSTRICWALEPNLVTSGKFRLEIINFSVGFPVLVVL